jgi:hypothetical protein
VEKCDVSLLKTAPEKRPAKLKTLVNSLTGSAAYEATAQEIRAAARLYNCTAYDIRDERLEYPEDIEW